MCKSTNVSGSIAGYYYQILLACKELTCNINEIEEVGIETDADIRVVNYLKKKQSIEAKFHKANMGLYDKDIIKTIYNFYRYSSMDEKLILSTNVSPTKDYIEFFLKWNSGSLGIEEKKCYVMKCIMRHCKNSVKPYSDNYEKYKKDEKSRLKEDKKESYYIENLEETIFYNDNFKLEIYKEYAYVDEKVTLDDFVKKLIFNFGNDRSKLDSISRLKKEIKLNLKSICDKQKKYIEESDYEKIQNLIIDKFFGIIAENSDLNENPKFDDMKKFSTKELMKCIDTYKEEKLQWICKKEIQNIIEQIDIDETFFNKLVNDNELSKKEELIDKHNLIKQEFLKKLTDKSFYKIFIETYTLESEAFENDIIQKIIYHLTIIAVYENKKIEDISFLEFNNSIENIYIKDLIKYIYKVCPYQYRNISTNMRKFLQDLKNKYGDKYINNISKGLTVVFNAQFRRNNRPCEKKTKEVFGIVDDITTADKDTLYKNYIIHKNIDYRCDDCIFIDGTDEEVRDSLNKFFNCKEEKNKNGVYSE
ncbi:hypothetical protein [Clostridium drakei]|uniref:Uncharacterized protein n=1 Tax=Clostridium drakei TaxID=332101 RepID=A0A2U8DUM7_9CLOT|nr:hypothetical protein [Clostridium drakei]AWI06339.1 hypothetical protein B9W14_18150 [Clostridium drakei]